MGLFASLRQEHKLTVRAAGGEGMRTALPFFSLFFCLFVCSLSFLGLFFSIKALTNAAGHPRQAALLCYIRP